MSRQHGDSSGGHYFLRCRRGFVVLLACTVLAALTLACLPTRALADDGDAVPMYRLYNQWSGEHLFTIDKGEHDGLVKIGWSDEGVAWQAPKTSATPVYRLYNPYSGDHHYTKDKAEYDACISQGWRGEDVSFYSADENGGMPIYRLFNQWLTQGTHLYTTDKAEYDNLGIIGWHQEGIAFYGVKENAEKTFDVKFVSKEDGQEKVIQESSLKEGDPIAKPADPVRDGFEFRGWNTDDNGKGDKLADDATCTADVTYYAVWSSVAPADKTTEDQTIKDMKFTDGTKAVDGQASDDGKSATVTGDDAKDVEPGDIVVLNEDDPENLKAIKVTDVKQDGDKMVVEGTRPDITEVFSDATIEGEAPLSSDKMQAGSGVQIENVTDSSEALTAADDTTAADGTANLPKIKLTINLDANVNTTPPKWADLFPDSSFAERHATKLNLHGTYVATISGSVQWDGSLKDGILGDGAGVSLIINRSETLDSTFKGSGKIHLATFEPAPGVALDLDVVFEADGTVKLTASQYDSFGVRFEHGSVNFPHEHSETTNFEAGVKGKIGLSLYGEFGIGNLAMLGGEGNLGVQCSANTKIRSTGLRCSDISAFFYLDFHFNSSLKAQLKFLEASASAKLDWIVCDEDNTPWKYGPKHLENGKEVDKCTWQTYQVSFRDPIKNETVKTADVGRGEKIQPFAPTAPAHDGWSFDHWERTDDEGTGETLDSSTECGEGSRNYTAVYTRTRSFGDGCSMKEDTLGNLRISPADGKSGTMARIDSIKYFTDPVSITIDAGVKAPGNSDCLFFDSDAYAYWGRRSSLKKIDANNLDTSGAYSMNDIFHKDNELTDLSGVSQWDVSGVTDMDNAFEDCDSLTDISGLASWDVSGVTDMDGLLSGCDSLTNLKGLENWNVSNACNAASLFYGCSSLRDISALANWDTSLFGSMNSMFSGCSSLSDLSPLSKWSLKAAESTSCMFHGCSRLTTLSGLENWNVSHVSDMGYMFQDCDRLRDASAPKSWSTSSLTTMKGMFSGCTQLRDISGLAGWDVSKVTALGDYSRRYSENYYGLFYNCKNLSDISALSAWDVSNVTDISNIFYGCSSLTNVDALSGWQTKNLRNMASFCQACYSLTSVEGLRNWDVSNVSDMVDAFSGCTLLKDLSPLEGWKVSGSCSKYGAFYECPGTPPSWYTSSSSSAKASSQLAEPSDEGQAAEESSLPAADATDGQTAGSADGQKETDAQSVDESLTAAQEGDGSELEQAA